MFTLRQMQDFLKEECVNLNLKILKFSTWNTKNNNINLDILIENIDNSPTGLAECSKLNKVALLWLKNANMLKNVNLSVAAPGINRELFCAEDYNRFIGSEVAIALKEIHEGKRNLKGFIKSVECDLINLESNSKIIQIELEKIEKASIVPDWEKIMKRAREKN